MYSLHLQCEIDQSEFVSAELWDAGTVAVREIDQDGRVALIAAFETNENRTELLARFACHSPVWHHEPATDWVAQIYAAWPARAVGERLFLAPVWSTEATPSGRMRLVHNPGLACGTGEHACTQLALTALEKCVTPGATVVDVGTGSGLLAIASLLLGAAKAIGIDLDEAALPAARENFGLNGLSSRLVTGSADSLASACADVTVANISGTVLLAMFDDLLRITRPGAWIILSGFPEAEAPFFERAFSRRQTLGNTEWRCVIARAP